MRPQTPTHPDDDRLLELAYGEVPAAEARTLRTHVDGCARCRTVLDGIAEVRTAFRAVPTEPAPERGLDSLLAYGEQAAARARSRRRGIRIVGVLSAVAALAVVWVVLPPPGRQAGDEAALARADRERAPAQGDRAKDEADKGGAPSSPAVVAQQALPEAKEERPATSPPSGPARRSVPAAPAPAEEKQRKLEKRDAPVEQKAFAQTPQSGRAESVTLDRAAERSNASGTLAASGSTSGGTFSGAVGGMKKSAAGADVAAETASSTTAAPTGAAANATRPQDAAKVAAAPSAAEAPSAAAADQARTPEAGKVAASPHADALASRPLAKAAPASEPASRVVPPPAKMRVGAGSAEQQARLADIQKRLPAARGDERKALLMEQCELEASLGRGPDAVLSCSMVSREFPGTPEAQRASELARGFSLQLPTPSESER
jgi:hypothetical protein